MYLSSLHIRQFRVFDDITLYFKNGINILIGENNSGKTAIIDALRICLGCGAHNIQLWWDYYNTIIKIVIMILWIVTMVMKH